MLLSLCLLLGAALSIMATTWWGQLPSFRRLQADHFKFFIIITILILGLSLLGLFMTTVIVFFISLFVITKVLSQYLVNTVDEHYVSVTSSIQLSKHSQNATLFQLVGIVAAPVYFSFLYAQPLINVIALSLISLLGLYTILSNISGQPYDVEKQVYPDQASSISKLNQSDRLFLVYIVISSSATLIFSANIIFLLQDYYQFRSPLQIGGILLGLINLTAILSVVLQKIIGPLIVGRKRSTLSRVGLSRIHISVSTISILLIILVFLKPSESALFLSIVFAILGVVYGLFRYYTREYASHIAKEYHRPRMLIMYNNMSNYSILISAIMMFALSLLVKVVVFSFLQLILWSVIGLFVISLLVVIRFVKHVK